MNVQRKERACGMASARWVLLISAFSALAFKGAAAEGFLGENLIEVKLSLPNPTTPGAIPEYVRGESDPVKDLVADITLTNKTKKENRNQEIVQIPTVTRIRGEELSKLDSLTEKERAAL